jgi:hypothetical protein
MQDHPQNREKPEAEIERSRSTLIIGCVVGLAILASIWFVVMAVPSQHGGTISATLELNSPERAYVQNLRIENVAMSRAENFLHQEVTNLNAEITNAGAQPVSGIAVTVEFSDEMKRIVLRETRPALGAASTVLGPREKRAFEISFDNVPATWNMQEPVLRITHFQFYATK